MHLAKPWTAGPLVGGGSRSIFSRGTCQGKAGPDVVLVPSAELKFQLVLGRQMYGL